MYGGILTLMGDFECLIPAAGRSSRMGSWKLMLPFAGKTVIETVVANALDVCPRVILVTGYRSDELTRMFAGNDRVCCIENTKWPEGMFSSIRCGVSAITGRRFFIALADMPAVSRRAFTVLMDARGDLDNRVVVPVRNSRRGHPVLLPSSIIPKVIQGGPEIVSMKDIIRTMPVLEISWDDDTIFRDIDTPDEYQSMLRSEGTGEGL